MLHVLFHRRGSKGGILVRSFAGTVGPMASFTLIGLASWLRQTLFMVDLRRLSEITRTVTIALLDLLRLRRVTI